MKYSVLINDDTVEQTIIITTAKANREMDQKDLIITIVGIVLQKLRK